jgi:hypothetical protein
MSASEAEKRAQKILSDSELSRLLSTPRERPQIDRARQIFVNRNLRMSRIELVGFDMDYTLAIYHMRRIEQLSFDMTLAKLVSEYGYPPEIAQVQYDHQFVMRGLAVDKLNGNLLKMDRFGYVGRAYHGRRPLSAELWRTLYREVRVRLKNPQYAWIDTLFAVPEACLYAGVIDLLEAKGVKIDYAKLYDDIRDAIDTVHRDNSLKQELHKNIGYFIYKDPELFWGQEALHSHQFILWVHPGSDELLAGWGSAGVPHLAALLRLHCHRCSQTDLFLGERAVPGSGHHDHPGSNPGPGPIPGAMEDLSRRESGGLRADDRIYRRSGALRRRSHLR